MKKTHTYMNNITIETILVNKKQKTKQLTIAAWTLNQSFCYRFASGSLVCFDRIENAMQKVHRWRSCILQQAIINLFSNQIWNKKENRQNINKIIIITFVIAAQPGWSTNARVLITTRLSLTSQCSDIPVARNICNAQKARHYRSSKERSILFKWKNQLF